MQAAARTFKDRFHALLLVLAPLVAALQILPSHSCLTHHTQPILHATVDQSPLTSEQTSSSARSAVVWGTNVAQTLHIDCKLAHTISPNYTRSQQQLLH